jgi:hypothetical protein
MMSLYEVAVVRGLVVTAGVDAAALDAAVVVAPPLVLPALVEPEEPVVVLPTQLISAEEDVNNVVHEESAGEPTSRVDCEGSGLSGGTSGITESETDGCAYTQ